MARSAVQRICLSCKQLILVGAHSRDCEFCGALIERCPQCRAPISSRAQLQCFSCTASVNRTSPQDDESDVLSLAHDGSGRGSRHHRRKSPSDWGLVVAVALVAAVFLAIYGFSSNWQGLGGGDPVVGDRAACLHAEGYRSDLATSDQAATNQRALDACRP